MFASKSFCLSLIGCFEFLQPSDRLEFLVFTIAFLALDQRSIHDFVHLDNFKQLGVTWLPPISMQCHQVRPPDSLHLLKLVCPLVKASFGQVHQAWSRFKLSQAVLGKLTIAPSNSSMCNISCDISTMQHLVSFKGGHLVKM